MNNATLQKFSFAVVCKDYWAITTASNVGFLKKMVKQENKDGNKYIKFLPGKNWVIQHYPGKDKKQIAKIIKDNLNNAGAELEK